MAPPADLWQIRHVVDSLPSATLGRRGLARLGAEDYQDSMDEARVHV